MTSADSRFCFVLFVEPVLEVPFWIVFPFSLRSLALFFKAAVVKSSTETKPCSAFCLIA